MYRLRNIAIRDYQESVTTGQSHRQTDAGESDPYVPLCFAGDTTKTLFLQIFGHLFLYQAKKSSMTVSSAKSLMTVSSNFLLDKCGVAKNDVFELFT